MKSADATYSSVFLSLFALFLTCLLVSNIIAGKLILVFGLVLPSAVILFPDHLHPRRRLHGGLRVREDEGCHLDGLRRERAHVRGFPRGARAPVS